MRKEISVRMVAAMVAGLMFMGQRVSADDEVKNRPQQQAAALPPENAVAEGANASQGLGVLPPIGPVQHGDQASATPHDQAKFGQEGGGAQTNVWIRHDVEGGQQVNRLIVGNAEQLGVTAKPGEEVQGTVKLADGSTKNATFVNDGGNLFAKVDGIDLHNVTSITLNEGSKETTIKPQEGSGGKWSPAANGPSLYAAFKDKSGGESNVWVRRDKSSDGSSGATLIVGNAAGALGADKAKEGTEVQGAVKGEDGKWTRVTFTISNGNLVAKDLGGVKADGVKSVVLYQDQKVAQRIDRSTDWRTASNSSGEKPNLYTKVGEGTSGGNLWIVPQGEKNELVFQPSAGSPLPDGTTRLTVTTKGGKSVEVEGTVDAGGVFRGTLPGGVAPTDVKSIKAGGADSASPTLARQFQFRPAGQQAPAAKAETPTSQPTPAAAPVSRFDAATSGFKDRPGAAPAEAKIQQERLGNESGPRVVTVSHRGIGEEGLSQVKVGGVEKPDLKVMRVSSEKVAVASKTGQDVVLDGDKSLTLSRPSSWNPLNWQSAASIELTPRR